MSTLYLQSACTLTFDYREAEDCLDGLDNDLDGQIDCQDGDCVMVCQEQNWCGDSVDNDGNGLTDETDPACWGVFAGAGVARRLTVNRCQSRSALEGNENELLPWIGNVAGADGAPLRGPLGGPNLEAEQPRLLEGPWTSTRILGTVELGPGAERSELELAAWEGVAPSTAPSETVSFMRRLDGQVVASSSRLPSQELVLGRVGVTQDASIAFEWSFGEVVNTEVCAGVTRCPAVSLRASLGDGPDGELVGRFVAVETDAFESAPVMTLRWSGRGIPRSLGLSGLVIRQDASLPCDEPNPPPAFAAMTRVLSLGGTDDDMLCLVGSDAEGQVLTLRGQASGTQNELPVWGEAEPFPDPNARIAVVSGSSNAAIWLAIVAPEAPGDALRTWQSEDCRAWSPGASISIAGRPAGLGTLSPVALGTDLQDRLTLWLAFDRGESRDATFRYGVWPCELDAADGSCRPLTIDGSTVAPMTANPDRRLSLPEVTGFVWGPVLLLINGQRQTGRLEIERTGETSATSGNLIAGNPLPTAFDRSLVQGAMWLTSIDRGVTGSPRRYGLLAYSARSHPEAHPRVGLALLELLTEREL